MKNSILIFLCFIIMQFESKKKESSGFLIKGVIKGIGNTKVLLGNKPNGYATGFKMKYFDSCVSIQDTFYFKGHVQEVGFYSIEVPEKSKGWITLVLENDIYTVKGVKDSIYMAKVEGGREWAAYEKLNDKLKNINNTKIAVFQRRWDSLNLTEDSHKRNIVLDSIKKYQKFSDNEVLKFIIDNPNAYASLYYLEQNSLSYEIDTVKKYFNLLTKKLQQSTLGKNMYHNIFKVSLGQQIPNFKLPNLEGTQIDLLKYRGKYIIIDFWASWCVPCIAEMPDLKRFYNQSNSQVEIVGISLDTSKERWAKSTEEQKINWVNLSDLNGTNSEIARNFGIKTIPQKFLLDPKGILLMQSSSILEIERMLNQLLDK